MEPPQPIFTVRQLCDLLPNLSAVGDYFDLGPCLKNINSIRTAVSQTKSEDNFHYGVELVGNHIRVTRTI